MESPKQYAVKITPDCGHQITIGVEHLADEYRCSACGYTGRISAANLALIHTRLGGTLMEADRLRTETDADAVAEWDFHQGRFI